MSGGRFFFFFLSCFSLPVFCLVAADLVLPGEPAALCRSLVPAARPSGGADLHFPLLAVGSGLVQPGGPVSSACQFGGRRVQGKHTRR